MTGVPCVSPILVLSSLSAVTSSPRLQARNERGQGQARRAGGQARAQPGAGGQAAGVVGVSGPGLDKGGGGGHRGDRGAGGDRAEPGRVAEDREEPGAADRAAVAPASAAVGPRNAGADRRRARQAMVWRCLGSGGAAGTATTAQPATARPRAAKTDGVGAERGGEPGGVQGPPGTAGRLGAGRACGAAGARLPRRGCGRGRGHVLLMLLVWAAGEVTAGQGW